MAGFPQALSSVLLLLLLILPGSAVAKVGYVSLNCGADGAGAFTDQQTGIRWVPDQAYISTGTSGVVSTAGLPQELQAVRYFPQYKKNCYKITVLPTFVYLIRAGFYYGNYDGFSSRRITFSLSLDNTPWETVDLTYNPAGLGKPTYIEAFTDGGPSTTLAVCLIREGRDVPFINSLEARLIDSSTAYTKVFEDEKIHMHLKGRANFGEKTATIRYPDDAWDRVWPPYVNEFPELSFVGTLTAPPNVTITNNVYSSRDEPPSIVMATALQGPVISYKRVIPPSSRIFASQYYAELNASLAPGDRRSIRWQASVADQSYIINITTAIQIYTTLEILLSGNLQVNDTVLAFTLDRDPERGTVDPILNAEELYTIHSVVLNATTQNDVDALLGIKRDLGLVQWVSDPCLPVAWDEVNCTAGVGTTSRITGLDLSRKSFRGPLPSTIAGLTSLETLLLNDNTFSGPFLDTFAGLTKLQTLNVANNGLSGPLPSWLESLTNLTVLDVSGNNFTGTVPDALLSRPNLNFSYGANQLVCSTPSCPPSPSPSPQNRHTTPPPPEQKKKKSNSVVLIVEAVVGGIALIAIIAIVAVGLYCCCNRKPKEPSAASTTGKLPRVSPTPSTKTWTAVEIFG